MGQTGERAVERWARSRTPLTTMVEVERRVLLESPRSCRPGVLERLRRSMLWFLVQLALFLTPIAGLAVMLASNGFGRSELDADTAVPIAGACFAFSPLFVAVLLGEWVRFGRPRSRGYLAHALLILLCGGLTLGLMTSGELVESWRLWSVPVWVAGASAVLFLALVVIGSHPDAQRDRPDPEHPLDVAALTPDEVAELLDVREQTLRTLADRELVDPALVERARDVGLGRLHMLDRTSPNDEACD